MFEKSVDLELMKIFYDSGLSTKKAFEQARKVKKQMEREIKKMNTDKNVVLNSVTPLAPMMVVLAADSLINTEFTVVKLVTYVGVGLIAINTGKRMYNAYLDNGKILNKYMLKIMVDGAISIFLLVITPGLLMKSIEAINEGCKFILPVLKKEIII